MSIGVVFKAMRTLLMAVRVVSIVPEAFGALQAAEVCNLQLIDLSAAMQSLWVNAALAQPDL